MYRIQTAIFMLILPAALWSQAPVLALKGNDPVELTHGKETPGFEQLSVVHGNYSYRFSSQENLQRFKQAPTSYAIQYGGACMRMGPMSGAGSPERWHVHDGKIYLFASEACRNSFVGHPERFIDQPDPAPTGSDDQQKRAAQLLEKAVVEIGGAELLRAVRSVVCKSGVAYISQGDTTLAERVESIGFPGSFRYEERYEGGGWSWLLLPGEGYDDAGSGNVVDTDVRVYMERLMHRKTLPILRAWVDGTASAYESGNAEVDGKKVTLVDIGIGGATTTLGIDPRTGRIRSASWRGRTASGIGTVEHRYSDYRCAAGLILPYEVAVFENGTQQHSPIVTIESIAVSEEADETMFLAPR